MSKCNQNGCEIQPIFRFTWPGKDEAHICVIHALQLQNVARHIGLHLQMIPLLPLAPDEAEEEPSNRSVSP